jgi:hypothetical protein
LTAALLRATPWCGDTVVVSFGCRCGDGGGDGDSGRRCDDAIRCADVDCDVLLLTSTTVAECWRGELVIASARREGDVVVFIGESRAKATCAGDSAEAPPNVRKSSSASRSSFARKSSCASSAMAVCECV